MSSTIYIRMKSKIQAKRNQTLYLSDVAYISGHEEWKEKLKDVELYRIKGTDRNIVILDVFRVIYTLHQLYKELELQAIGPNQTIVTIPTNKKQPSLILVCVIWMLLFIGAAMAIMNFHYDVSMEEVQQRLHFLLTGEEEEHPLWIQIPYSLGLGLGMILFFNHLFKKRINEEPSPLEVEMHKYQQDLDQYIVYHENHITKDSDPNDSSSN
ncbi:stage V sporulation protein AA [Pontibacillus yanchengensis]|uniref:Stage V sporulation protein AA n=2 Tax=Pontibacillus yanchengensis TaxID=462910 RepID=A0A6I4ZY38_9BACI|nr:stage V sporulation protein AA [Pontibacillus yanchengensis]MYL32673.1 stage V sporulation protein AA [Pontibacillus yanchengensis]MYL55067.1 stage V sporulation protein AA [Pontibacillus yanchengensis]